MKNLSLTLQKALGFISGIALIIYGYIFNHMVGTLQGGMERFTYLAILLLIIGGINIIVIIISYVKKSFKIDSLIGIRLVLVFIGRLTYFFKDAQTDYNFFLTCLYLYFGVFSCITTLLSMSCKLTYKKKYTNIIFFCIGILQAFLLSGVIKGIGSYASSRCIGTLTVWLGLNITLLSYISIKSKD